MLEQSTVEVITTKKHCQRHNQGKNKRFTFTFGFNVNIWFYLTLLLTDSEKRLSRTRHRDLSEDSAGAQPETGHARMPPLKAQRDNNTALTPNPGVRLQPHLNRR